VEETVRLWLYLVVAPMLGLVIGFLLVAEGVV
jgi:hypothetical protein